MVATEQKNTTFNRWYQRWWWYTIILLRMKKDMERNVYYKSNLNLNIQCKNELILASYPMRITIDSEYWLFALCFVFFLGETVHLWNTQLLVFTHVHILSNMNGSRSKYDVFYQMRIFCCLIKTFTYFVFFFSGIQATNAIQVVTVYRAIHSYGRCDAIVWIFYETVNQAGCNERNGQFGQNLPRSR